MTARLKAIYHVRGEAGSIEARAQAIAVEQSVEMPVDAIDDAFVLSEIVGRVESIAEISPGTFEVEVGLSAETISDDPGQLLNMLFGNTSLHDDVTLHDMVLPPEVIACFGGPHQGLDGLRARVGARDRALTCSALKPQGLPSPDLADLAHRLALGGLDYIKDDHGLADQAFSPFAQRAAACAEAVRLASEFTGHQTRYIPSVSGHLDRMRQQLEFARDVGIDTVMIAPMIAGFSNVWLLAREYPDVAFLAHPTMGGASRIAPTLLISRLFRLVGADGVIFPNSGGRFGYSRETCKAIAARALEPWESLQSSAPIPAGGMTLERVPEMLSFYGADVILLVGGALLSARSELVAATKAFTAAVADHNYA
ncbi:ribulose-bisphosphate carboxylase large chain [Rhodoligotrophos appendicifer]|uniref:RuBisCO large subunit C-terminal-like domain-containing protein n=1 Tax=Rhodoligotrophos appendicifer TaxID=987056 RepID=UPI00117CBB8E|nr:RuBisCO large subunit C-terminal-like domain-containing protein [Rhodoligotrophos appendicifer]